MSEKRRGRHSKQHEKHEPQGHNEAPDHTKPGHVEVSHHGNGHWHPYGELHYAQHGSRGFDLAHAAIEELHEAGFRPEFGQGVQEQVSEIERGIAHGHDAKSAADLRGLGWSSIDNDTSRDLDQIEV